MEQSGFVRGRSGMAAAVGIQGVMLHRPLVTSQSDDSAGFFIFMSLAALWLILG